MQAFTPLLTNCYGVISIRTCYNSIQSPWNSWAITCTCRQCGQGPFWAWEGRWRLVTTMSCYYTVLWQKHHCMGATSSPNNLSAPQKNPSTPYKILQRPTKLIQLPRRFFSVHQKSLSAPGKILHLPEKSFIIQKILQLSINPTAPQKNASAR